MLPLEAFNRYKDGRQWWCRACFKAYFRQRGQRHTEQVMKARDLRRARAHEYVLLHLRGRPCVECGETDPIVLEFDHVGAKAYEISTLVSDSTRLDLIRVEVGRCEVVCCNCHRRRTYARRGTTRMAGSTEHIKNRRVRRNIEWLYSYLSTSRCVDCDVADPLVLEFDHLRMKRKNVMTMAWEGYGQDTIRIEMNKCEIRCANCHRRKTAAAGKYFRHMAATGARGDCLGRG